MTIIVGNRRTTLLHITPSHPVNYLLIRPYIFVTVYSPPPPTPLSDTLSIALAHPLAPYFPLHHGPPLIHKSRHPSVPYFHHSNVDEQEAMLMQTRMLQDTVALFKRR